MQREMSRRFLIEKNIASTDKHSWKKSRTQAQRFRVTYRAEWSECLQCSYGVTGLVSTCYTAVINLPAGKCVHTGMSWIAEGRIDRTAIALPSVFPQRIYITKFLKTALKTKRANRFSLGNCICNANSQSRSNIEIARSIFRSFNVNIYNIGVNIVNITCV